MGDSGRESDIFYTVYAQEAAGLYSQMLTIATVFLGGSVAVLGRDLELPLWGRLFLVLSWVFFVIAIGLLLHVRWGNVEAHRHIMESMKDEKSERNQKEYGQARSIAERTRTQTVAAIKLVVLGFAALAISAAVALLG